MTFGRELPIKRALSEHTLRNILDEDKALREALDGDTTAAAKVWVSIADGSASVGRVLVWASNIAGRVNKEVISIDTEQPGEKARAALLSIGIRGRIDKHRAIRELMAALDGFNNLEYPDEPETHKRWVEICRSHGLLDGLDDSQAYTLIRDIRQGRR